MVDASSPTVLNAKTTCTVFRLRKYLSVAGMNEKTLQLRAIGRAAGVSRLVPVHTLKNHSGMAMMYFKLNDQRSTILMGSAAINSTRFENTM